MNRIVAGGALFCAAILSCIQPGAVRAQDLQNSRIDFVYDEPKKSAFDAIYARLKKRQVLEQLKQFLSPLRVPKKLTLRTLECGVVNAFYDPGQKSLKLCYEYFDDLENRIAKAQMPPGYEKADAVVGGFLGVTFHELGHASFDLLDAPVFGREEDAADQMAGFILQQFGPKISRRMISGTAYMWLSKDRTYTRTAFSDEHGTDLQRHYNFLCLGYGGPDSNTFQEFVDKGALPKERAANCKREYELVRNAFRKTVLPFVDLALMKKVQSTEWLRAEDFK
jgi:putative metallopeptidase DUF4344